jgi:hypothetical protein
LLGRVIAAFDAARGPGENDLGHLLTTPIKVRRLRQRSQKGLA